MNNSSILKTLRNQASSVTLFQNFSHLFEKEIRLSPAPPNTYEYLTRCPEESALEKADRSVITYSGFHPVILDTERLSSLWIIALK